MRKVLVVCILAFLAAVVALPGVAQAHAAYKSSEPGDRSSVGSPPSRVTAEFTEPLADGSYLQVTDPCGSRVDAGDVSIVGYEMGVSMSATRSGNYSVFYKALSRLDPHVVEGTFSFTATSGPPCPSEAEDPPASEEDPGQRPARTDEDSADQPETVFAQSNAGGGGQSSNPDGDSPGRSADRARSRPPGRAPTSARVPNVAAPDRQDDEQRSVYDGIPMRSFAVSLLLSALIGAAGGKIYAGIMGPRA